MPRYRRPSVAGATYFLTIVTHGRHPLFLDAKARKLLGEAIRRTRADRPFAVVAAVVLPDHVHLLMELPIGDADVSPRVAAIKARFTRAWLAGGGMDLGQSEGRHRQRRRGVWQQRFHDHRIRDDDDLQRHLDYAMYNPVHHGVVACPHAWLHSSFHRLVKDGVYDAAWSCGCGRAEVKPPVVPSHMVGID